MLRDSQPAEHSQHHLTERPGAHTQYNTLIRDVAKVAHNLENEQTNSGQHSGINAILDEVYGTALKGKSQEYQQAFANMLDIKLTQDGTKGLVVDKFAEENFDFLSSGKKRITINDLDGKADELGMMGRGLEKYLTEDVLLKSEQIGSSVKEHKFLGFGTKEGFDRRQLFKDEANERTNIALNPPRMPWQFGPEDAATTEAVQPTVRPVDVVVQPIDSSIIVKVPDTIRPIRPRPIEPIPTHPVDPFYPVRPVFPDVSRTHVDSVPSIKSPVEPDRVTPKTLSAFDSFAPLDLVGPAGAI